MTERKKEVEKERNTKEQVERKKKGRGNEKKKERKERKKRVFANNLRLLNWYNYF